MAVEQWIEHVEGRSGSINDQREREYVRVFKFMMSRATDGPEVIQLHPACPRPWSVYVSASGIVDTGSWCRDVRFDVDSNDPYTWTVVASYSSRVNRPDINLIENPLLRPSDISWGTTREMVPMEFDADGTPVRNTAGDLFDPPLEKPRTTAILRIGKNLPTYDARLYVDYENTVNEKPFFTFGKWQVKCEHITGKRQFENGILFWRVDFEFHIRGAQLADDAPGGDARMKEHKYAWSKFVLNRGWRETDTINGGTKPIMVYGQPITSPAFLDADGKAINLPPIPPRLSGDPVWLKFEPHPIKDFGVLPVP